MRISQGTLSAEVDMTTTYLSLLENRRRFPLWETLERIAQMLSAKPSELISEANLSKYDPDFELVRLLSRIIESTDEKKIERLSDFVASLR